MFSSASFDNHQNARMVRMVNMSSPDHAFALHKLHKVLLRVFLELKSRLCTIYLTWQSVAETYMFASC